MQPGIALALDAAKIGQAEPRDKAPSKNAIDPLTIKTQILLDRAHFSPGEIDGKHGENLDKALTAFAQAQGLSWQGRYSPELWAKLVAQAPDDLLNDYAVTEDDLRGPFLDKVPTKMEEMKELPALGYGSARELLAERFHVSEELLRALNPRASFDEAGETIVVPFVVDNPLEGKVAKIEVDKQKQTIKAFDEKDQLLAFYPATVGSEEKPAPSGTLRVTNVTENPDYRYNPDYAFRGVKSEKPFTIKSGPNNPVGVLWIGLSQKGYGIHGTADPAKVSKTESHGCVRLTNWDALQLGAAVRKGTVVEFIGTGAGEETSGSASPSRNGARTQR